MAVKNKIKELATAKHISIAELERKLDFANGSISKWNKQSPSAERLQRVAEYFDVSVDYLLGENDDQKKKTSVDLNDDDVIMTFDGKPIPDEDKELIKRILRGK